MNDLPKISTAFLMTTNRCNLHCRYCFVSQNPKDMSFTIAKDSVSFLVKNAKLNNAIPNIVFFGGEPLLKWDDIIVPLTKYIRNELKTPFNLSITSNCTLMTEDKLKFMKENNIGLLFSIDGDKNTQDFNRPFHNGIGTFDVLKDKIPMILKYFPTVTFRSTIHQPTCKYLFENIKFAHEQGFTNTFFVPNQFENWTEKNKKILKNELRKFSDYFILSIHNKKSIIKFSELEKSFYKVLKLDKIIDNPVKERMKITHKCGIGTNVGSSISVDGKIYGCQELTTNGEAFCFGDIYSGVDINKRIALIKSFDNKKVVGLNKCRNCKLYQICNGGCVANNFLLNNNVNIMPDIFCFWEQLLLDEAIYIMNVLGKEKNEYFKNYIKRRCR